MNVNEMFISIQGEGPESGRRALFVRFSGCNLSCKFCDSKYALYTYLEADVNQIMDMVDRSGCKYVVLTGGEPTIQEDFVELLDTLERDNYQVDVETNGTNLPDAYRMQVRYIVSPKSLEVAEMWLPNHKGVRYVFKFVVDLESIDELFAWVQTNCKVPTKPPWFMPLTTNAKANPQCMIDEMTSMGRIVMAYMNKYQVDGYLCTRLQNLYRVR
jgi:7-carboxy-7-deazaguanine synthase